MSAKVSVVIVSFNCKNDLRECLESLQIQNENIEIIVIDNASRDGTREMLKTEFQNWANLKTIFNDSNLGLTRANNQAIPYCSGEYILFLNPDTILKPDTIKHLASYLDSHPNVGVIGPKILFETGALQYSFGSFPTLLSMALMQLFPSYKYRRIPLIHRYLHIEWASNGPKEVDWVSAACMMIRKDLIVQLGGFDENIFLSYADSPEICRRVKKMGYLVIYYPKIEIIHKQGKSITNDVRLPVLLYAHQGWLYYFRKYHGIISTIILRIIFSLSSIEKALVAFLLSLANPEKYWPIFKSHFVAAFKIWSLSIPIKRTKV